MASVEKLHGSGPAGAGAPTSRLYERVRRWLVTYVEQQGLQVGDRLPAERELAAHLGVSRASIRQAVVALQAQGIVAMRQGAGTYLRRQPGEARLDALLERRQRHPEVLETRAALEVKLAGLAASRRSVADLAGIDAALDAMEQEIADGGIGAGGDEAFHAAVTAAAHNGLMAQLMASLAGLIEETRLESLSEPGRRRRSMAQHRRIADAIRAGEPAAAEAAMREHIDTVADVVLLREAGEGGSA